jgi:hypothetical protein
VARGYRLPALAISACWIDPLSWGISHADDFTQFPNFARLRRRRPSVMRTKTSAADAARVVASRHQPPRLAHLGVGLGVQGPIASFHPQGTAFSASSAWNCASFGFTLASALGDCPSADAADKR